MNNVVLGKKPGIIDEAWRILREFNCGMARISLLTWASVMIPRGGVWALIGF